MADEKQGREPQAAEAKHEDAELSEEQLEEAAGGALGGGASYTSGGGANYQSGLFQKIRSFFHNY